MKTIFFLWCDYCRLMSNPKKWREASLLITIKFQIKKKKMKTKQTFLLQILAIAALTISCNTPNEPVNNSLTLSAEVSCTEAWLKLSANNVSLPKGITITRDGNNLFSFTLTTRDTTLYDSTLTPNKSYTYQALLSPLGGQSNKIVATTLDTTSHNFSWQMFTLGEADAGSSVLNDVAIVNDTLAYAVGEIYVNDSTGHPSPNAYNLAKWNGHTWQLFKIQFYTFCGQEHTGSYRANAVAVLNDTTVWIASNNSQIAVWNGNKQTEIMCLPVSVSKIWAANKNDVYTIGALGQIGHYTNGAWQKIESGTTLNINDIYGAYSNKTNKYEILTVASNILSSLDREIIQINNSQANIIDKKGVQGTLSSVWFKPNTKYYVGGGGIYEKNKLNESKWKNNPFDVTRYYTYKMRGLEVNDIAAVGGVGEVLHYNGEKWKSYIEEVGLSRGNYYSVTMKENLIIAVGYNSRQAAITIGWRK